MYREAAHSSPGFQVANFFTEDRNEMIREIATGMLDSPKSIPSKYFYDEEGSRLFEKICGTPEYYLTRTELSILEERGSEIMAFFNRRPGDLVELGSGSSLKIRKLLEAAGPGVSRNLRYVPVEICGKAMAEAAGDLLKYHSDLEIYGIIADFTRRLDVLPRGRKLLAFLGSSISNFSDPERESFLAETARSLKPGDGFLIGLDMLKSAHVLEAAYNDAAGWTRRFNRNILAHLNRKIQADFAPEAFEHVALFREDLGRVEMYLQAKKKMIVNLRAAGLALHLERGEAIRTEICRKFSRKEIAGEFERAGYSIAGWFTDPKEWFSLVLLSRSGD